jgi:hypothetical protein
VTRDTSGLKRGGSPGRPNGVPNKATLEAKAVCAALVDDPECQAGLAKPLKAGQLAPALEAVLWYYAKGKPKEHIEREGAMEISWRGDDLVTRLQRARQRVAERTGPATVASAVIEAGKP